MALLVAGGGGAGVPAGTGFRGRALQRGPLAGRPRRRHGLRPRAGSLRRGGGARHARQPTHSPRCTRYQPQRSKPTSAISPLRPPFFFPWFTHDQRCQTGLWVMHCRVILPRSLAMCSRRMPLSHDFAACICPRHHGRLRRCERATGCFTEDHRRHRPLWARAGLMRGIFRVVGLIDALFQAGNTLPLAPHPDMIPPSVSGDLPRAAVLGRGRARARGGLVAAARHGEAPQPLRRGLGALAHIPLRLPLPRRNGRTAHVDPLLAQHGDSLLHVRGVFAQATTCRNLTQTASTFIAL